MKCAGNSHEDCGGADIVLVFPFSCAGPSPAPPPANYSGLIPSLLPNSSYTGTPRMYQPAVRTLFSKAEAAAGVVLQATVLSPTAPSVVAVTVCGSVGDAARGGRHLPSPLSA